MAALRRPQTSASSLPLSKLWGTSSINDATGRRKPLTRRGGRLVHAEASGCISLECCMLYTSFATQYCFRENKCCRKVLAIQERECYVTKELLTASRHLESSQ